MYCKECGAKIEDENFCNECGANLKTSTPNPKEVSISEKNQLRKLTSWESILLLFLIPGILYFLSPILAGITFVLGIIVILYNDNQTRAG